MLNDRAFGWTLLDKVMDGKERKKDSLALPSAAV
jgi:hypothetical protein